MSSKSSAQDDLEARAEKNQLDQEIAQQNSQLAIQKRKAQRKALKSIAESLGSNSGFNSLPDDNNARFPNYPKFRGNKSMLG